MLWSLLALIGLVLLLVETFAHPERPHRPVYQMVEAGVVLLGIIAASPHVARAFETFQELLAPAPEAITFKAGSTVAVMPNGALDSAELKTPHLIDGLNMIGKVKLRTSGTDAGKEVTRVWEGTLVAEQEMPNLPGLWCSPKRPIMMMSRLVHIAGRGGPGGSQWHPISGLIYCAS